MDPRLKSRFCNLCLLPPDHEIVTNLDFIFARVASYPTQDEVSRLLLNISELTTDGGRHLIAHISRFPHPSHRMVFAYHLCYLPTRNLLHFERNSFLIMDPSLKSLFYTKFKIIPWSHHHQKVRTHFHSTRDASSPIRAPVFDSHSSSPISSQSLHWRSNPGSALTYSRAHSQWLYIFSHSNKLSMTELHVWCAKNTKTYSKNRIRFETGVYKMM